MSEKVKTAIAEQAFDQDGGLVMPGFNTEEKLISQLANTLTALRMLSLNVVDCYTAWRDQMHFCQAVSGIQQAVVYEYGDGANYLARMRTDTKFLRASPLYQYFNFSDKSDPFLVGPTRYGTSDSGHPKIVIPVDKFLQHKIQANEMTLMREALLTRR